jgi:hypothetical protein
MAGVYKNKTVSRWTKRRRLNDEFRRDMSDVNVDVSDSSFSDVEISCDESPAADFADDIDKLRSISRGIDCNTQSNSPIATPTITGCSEADKAKSFLKSSSDTDSDADIITDSDADVSDNLADELRDWYAEFNVTHAAMNGMLKILKKRHAELPGDCRTLLQTVSQVNVQEIAGGKFFYFGLVNTLTNIIDTYDIQENVIDLQLNVDGLPIHKSVPADFWPILGLVVNCKQKEPFIIGLFFGPAKPSNVAEFLQPFVDEFLAIQGSGFLCKEKCYTVKISAVICDTPARAFIKCVKSHNGYEGCDKCVQEGEYFQRRMTFPETNAKLRTDESFKLMHCEDHHTGTSPLLALPIGMVSNFPIDYMHSVCLGVVRKLLHMWLKGPLKTRLGGQSVTILSERLCNLRNSVPCEFNRKPRSVNEVDRWKATEFRQLILYTGPVCLQGLLPSELYDNYMLLSLGVYILLNGNFNVQFIDYAETILKQFVEHSGCLYGQEFLSYNVHVTVHLANEVRQYGSLDNVAAFVFENFLGKIKRMLRKPGLPLQQIVKRLSEKRAHSLSVPCCALQKEHSDGPVPSYIRGCKQFTEYHQSSFKIIISSSMKDSCMIIDGKPAVAKNFLENGADHIVVYRHFNDIQSLYTYPCNSDIFRIFSVSVQFGDECVAPVSAINQKCVLLKLPNGSRSAVIPLVHM